MLKSVRHDQLLQLLQAQGAAPIQDISRHLGVSAATVRRDLAELESKALVERTWGGVRLASHVDDPFQVALARAGAGKLRIGDAAAHLIPEGATIILDIGTTVHHVAMGLRDRSVTVLTASLPAFEVLRAGGRADIILLGGHWSEQYQCFDGEPVIDALAHQQADIAFIGCSGVSDTGRVCDTSYSQNGIKRAIRAASTRAYLLADAEKFPGKGGSSPFGVDELDGIITDASKLSDQLLETCTAHQTEVHFV